MVLGILHILLASGILFGPGETWAYYYWYTVLEIGFHALVVLHAIKWPKTHSVAFEGLSDAVV